MRSQQEKLQILVAGHANGVRLLWREGVRRNDADKARKQNDSRYLGYQAGHSAVIAVKDIPLGGSQALHIAVPPLSTSGDHETFSLPSLFSRRLVIAVACSDLNIRLVTAPIDPPASPASPAEAHYKFEVLELANPQGCSNLPNSVAVTFTTSPEPEIQDEDMSMLDAQATGASAESQGGMSKRVAQRETRSAEPEAQKWDLLIASHFPDLSGVLYIHRLPLSQGGLDVPMEPRPPSQTYFLSSPATTLRYSSAAYPSPRHSRLLIVQHGGTVKVLDNSLAESGDRSPWISTFFTPFEPLNHRSLPRRVSILDASWMLGAKAILILLSDGKWGVWDIDGAGPKSPNPPPGNIHSTSNSGFVLSGSVGALDKLGISDNNSKSEVKSKPKLAPMTPATRKVRSEKLFAEKAPERRDLFLQGGTSVIPASMSVRSRADDETVLLWHGSTMAVIPSFVAHWQSKVKGSGPLLANGSRGAIKTMRGVHLGGERCQEVVLCPALNGGSAELEMAVTAERCLVVANQEAKKSQHAKSSPAPEDGSDIFMDEDQLAAGDLSIQGMNRILDGMSSQQNLLLPNVSNSGSLL